jgi:hypothetical protein
MIKTPIKMKTWKVKLHCRPNGTELNEIIIIKQIKPAKHKTKVFDLMHTIHLKKKFAFQNNEEIGNKQCLFLCQKLFWPPIIISKNNFCFSK